MLDSPFQTAHRPTCARIDLAAFRRNLDFVRQRVGPKVKVVAVVKAHAYGHGMKVLAREALAWGADFLGVATVDEALELRETAGFSRTPILLLGPTMPTDADALVAASISTAVGTPELLKAMFQAGESRTIVPRIHLKIDTGMGRYGFAPHHHDSFLAFGKMPGALEGLMTHFSVSDGTSAEEIAYTNQQMDAFERVAAAVRSLGMTPILHAANSGGVLHHPRSFYDMVRPGMMLYGANPDPHGAEFPLHQVMTLATRIVAIHEHRAGDAISYGRTYRMPRDGRVAILPVGYGDGLPRILSNKMSVLLRGRRLAQSGRICMDQTMVDVTELPEAAVGDEVVLYGSQGGERIALEEVARLATTIPYEITCQVGRRVPREYSGSIA